MVELTSVTTIPFRNRRRHFDSPRFWLGAIAGSIAVHVFLFWSARLQTQVVSEVVDPALVPIEIIELPPEAPAADTPSSVAEATPETSAEPDPATTPPEEASEGVPESQGVTEAAIAPTTPEETVPDETTPAVPLDPSAIATPSSSEVATAPPDPFPDASTDTPLQQPNITPSPIPDATPTPNVPPFGSFPTPQPPTVFSPRLPDAVSQPPESGLPPEQPILPSSPESSEANTAIPDPAPASTSLPTASNPAATLTPPPAPEAPPPAPEQPAPDLGPLAQVPVEQEAVPAAISATLTAGPVPAEDNPQDIPDQIAYPTQTSRQLTTDISSCTLTPESVRYLGQTVGLIVTIDDIGSVVSEATMVRDSVDQGAYDQLATCLMNDWEFRPATNQGGSPVWSNLYVRITIRGL